MRKLTFLLACLLVASIGLVNAQSRTASGKVISAEDGQPVIGASISVKGASGVGTITNVDGYFTLNLPANSKTLVVSYIGMKSQEVEGKANMVIQLESSSSELDEMIVIAYGTAKRAQFVGSAATVDNKQLTARSTSNITNALQGAAPGVQVVNGSGQPGTSATIRIRGVGSINGGTTPLYVVDGAQYNTSALNLLDPHDIESMSILKDAAATAIYGARGANGVVLITTKKGAASGGTATVNVDAKWGNSSRAVPNYDVMSDPAMYYETLYKALYNSRAYAGNSASDSYAFADANIFSQTGAGYQVYTVPAGERFIGNNFKLNPKATLGYKQGDYYYTPDNWEDETLNRNNMRQEYNVQISGSNEKTNYFISGGFLDDPGLISGSGFKRYTLRSNIDSQIKSWLKAGANITYGYSDYQNPGYQTNWGSSANVFSNANLMAPIYPFYVRNADGSLKVDANGYNVYDTGNSTDFLRPGSAPKGNHAINLLIDQNHDYTDYVNSNFYLLFTPFSGFSFTARINPSIANDRSMSLSNPFYGSPSTEGSVTVSHQRYVTMNQQYIANYKKAFGLHNFEALVGFENYTLLLQSLSGSNDHLYDPFIGELSNAYGTDPASSRVSSNSEHYATAGFFGRLQYDYGSKYFFNATVRHEGSSRFAPEQRWGTFGSVGAAWMISREDFMDATNEWLQELKIKSSFGTQGNDQLRNYYAFRDLYNISYNSTTGQYNQVLNSKGNKDLKWESQQLFNVGAEFLLFKERLSGGVDYFSRLNSDMLFSIPMPPSVGYLNEPQNVGSVINSGVEAELNYKIIKNRNIEWSVYGNITFINAKIKKLPDYVQTLTIKGIQQNSSILKEGGSLNQIYLVQYAGVDPNTGASLYYTDPDNGDMTTTPNFADAKKADLGDASIDAYGGFGTNLDAYGFDFGAQFAYQIGGLAYDGTYQELMHTGKQSGRNWHYDILNAWTPDNTNTNIPRINTSDDIDQQNCDRFLVSTSYIGLNSLTLGYTLPSKLTKKLQINKLRFYVTGDNLALWSARKGFDPRQTQNSQASGLAISTSSGNYVYSQMRSISGGVSLTF
jgi:TonB-linked SusC/RagA family outer membrane protein